MSRGLIRRLLHLEGKPTGDDAPPVDSGRALGRVVALEDGKTPLPERIPVGPRRPGGPEPAPSAGPPPLPGRGWHVPTEEERREGARRALEAWETYQRQMELERERGHSELIGPILRVSAIVVFILVSVILRTC